MDGTSQGGPGPGILDVWQTTVGAGALPVTTTTIDLAAHAGDAVNAPQNCIIEWPNWQPWQPTFVPAVPAPTVAPCVFGCTCAKHFNAQLSVLTDADVERIAKRAADIVVERIAELLKGVR